MTCSEHWQVTKDAINEIWLNGFTSSREPAKELAALARSWLQAPEMRLVGQSGAKQYGYDLGARAYLIDFESAKQPEVQVRLVAGEDSPIVNPTFLINNWGNKNPRLEIDGTAVRRGKDFRTGHYKTLDIEDGREWKNVLIVWVEANSTKPMEFAFLPEGYHSSRTAESRGDDAKAARNPIAAKAPAHRMWTSGNYSTQARLVTVVDGVVYLKKPDGKMIKVPYAKLSPADQKFLDDWKKPK